MMDAAERIVATRGLDALTLREVQETSGQKNKSAATYHFGSREGLIGSVLLRLVGTFNARREVMINSMEIPLQDAPRDTLVELMIAPHLDGVFSSDTSYEARFLHQCSMHPSLINLVRHRGRDQNVLSVRRLLTDRLDHLSPASRVIRLDYVMSLVTTWMAQYEAFRDFDVMPAIPAAIAREDLLNLCIAMIDSRADAAGQVDNDWHTTYTKTWRLDEPDANAFAVPSDGA